jgi:ribosomal protein L34E
MKRATGGSRRLNLYQARNGGSIFLQPQKIKSGKFTTKTPTRNFGGAIPSNVNDEELGRRIREALEECDYE